MNGAHLELLWKSAATDDLRDSAWLSLSKSDSPRRRGIVETSRDLFRTQLANDIEPGVASAMIDQLDRVPVFQTADHLQLLLDPATFTNDVATLVGAHRSGNHHVLIRACSSNTLRTGPGYGPGLFLGLNVFGLNRDALRHSVYAHRQPVSFAFTQQGKKTDAGALLRELLGEQPHDSPISAFQHANRVVWHHLGFDQIAELVQLDSGFSARLVARHIRLGSGPVFALLFDPAVRESCLARRRESSLRHQTELLWGVANQRIRPMTLDGTLLRDADGHLSINYQPDDLSAALDAGTLLPDISLTYLAENLLPDLFTLGCPNQCHYVPVLWQLFDLPPGRWGATALVDGELDREPIELLRLGPVAARQWLMDLGRVS